MRKFFISKQTKMQKSVSIMLTFLLFLCVTEAFGQNSTVTGTVTDTSGETLIGVNVSVKGTTNGTITDFEGKYTLQGISAQSVLVFSYIGYITQEVATRNQSNIPIVLQEDVQGLEEVVVTGYSTQRKRDLTGAVAVVKLDEIQNIVATDVMKTLQGQVPGLFITGNGNPTDNATVRVRGVSTLSNSTPLYIIDGIPTTQSLSTLASSDIESIQVLKDASAASIYGSRASNGVIIVTTKKADRQTSSVRYRSSLNVKTYAQKPLNWLNAYDRGWVQWRAARNDGTLPNFSGYIFKDHQDANGEWILDSIEYAEWVDANKTMRPADTDWVSLILQESVTQNHNLTVSTGGTKGRSLLALDYLDNVGQIKGTYNNRMSLRVNSDYDVIKDKVNIAQTLSITHTKSSNVSGGSLLGYTRTIQPIIPVHREDGIGWGGNTGLMNDDAPNPLRVIEDNKNNYNNALRLFGNLSADVEIIKNLHFKTMLSLDLRFNYYRRLTLPWSNGDYSSDRSSVQNQFNRSNTLTWNNTLNYKFKYNEHNFDILIGHEQIDSGSENQSYTRDDYDIFDPDYMYIFAGSSAVIPSGSASQNRMLSYFGQVNYNYNDKYLFKIVLRYDGSSRFGANYRFGTFPAFSLGWRLSEEGFFKSALPFISDLKLRYGWGMTGNQAGINDFAAYGLYSASYSSTWINDTQYDSSTAYDITGAGSGIRPMGFRQTQLPNPALRWEAATQNNAGIDFGLFAQKLTGSADYFFINTKDILVTPPTLAVMGEGSGQTVNGATMENRGYEFQLAYRDRKGDLRYIITANLSAYRNKVTYLPEEVLSQYPGDGVYKTIIGRPRNSVFGYYADGLFQSQEEVDAHPTQSGKGVGRIRYRDIGGPNGSTEPDGQITTADRDFICTTDPDFIYGLSFNLQYKQWDLNMLWNGVQGKYDNVLSTKRNVNFVGAASSAGGNQGKGTLNAWSPDNTNTDVPRLSLRDTNTEAGTRGSSTYFYENTSYFKLRNVEIGYTIPRVLTSKILIQNAHFYLLGENLFKVYKKKGDRRFTGADPETPNTDYPLPLSFTVGLNLTF